MKQVDIPTKFPIPFAENAGLGFVNPIPETTVTPGRASLDQGFPPINFDDPAAGGIPPFGGDFNGIFLIVTQWLQWAQAGGTVQYDAGFAADIGGYPKGAVLMSNPPAHFWLCTADDNSTDPDASGAGWVDPYGGFAPINSPTFTGIPAAPTATGGTNTSQIATTAFVAAAIAALAPLASPAFTGNPTAPTQSPGNNSTRLANTAFVTAALTAAIAGLAPLLSPGFSGTPTAPTAGPGDNSTLLATTAFVQQEISGGLATTGMVAFFAMQNPPDGWLFCDGGAVNRTTYAALFALIGTTFGAGDGSTSFNLPDLRGQFVRGWSDVGPVDPGRVFGSLQAFATQSHVHITELADAGGRVSQLDGSGGGRVGMGFSNSYVASVQRTSYGNSGNTANETRPTNMALYACIRT